MKLLKFGPYSKKYVPLIVIVLSVLILSFIPFKILSCGYLPIDDALRHAAKAVSGKDWNQILVLRDGIKMDGHVGWHIILSSIRMMAGWNVFSLVLFSVVILFSLFSLTGISLSRRPEAFLIAMLAVCVADIGLIPRLLMGRPFIVTMSAVLALYLLWPKLKSEKIPYKAIAVLTLFTAAAVWIHCGWFMFILPAASFFLAGERRAGFRASAAIFMGIAIGAMLTGHPVMFFVQTIRQVMLELGNHSLTRMLVTELEPSFGDFPVVLLVVIMLMWRALRGAWHISAVKNPVFMLLASSWILGFFTTRFWVDLGLPAVILFLTEEFQNFLEDRMGRLSWKRIVVTIVSVCTLYMACINDRGGFWSNIHPGVCLSLDNPEQAPWLPEPGGVLYSDDMGVFYNTFYKNPNAPWRYILGYAPTFMPKDDLKVYRNIQLTRGSSESYMPWIRKMKPRDRLILVRPSDWKPDIPSLEWHNIPDVIWVGFIPKAKK